MYHAADSAPFSHNNSYAIDIGSNGSFESDEDHLKGHPIRPGGLRSLFTGRGRSYSRSQLQFQRMITMTMVSLLGLISVVFMFFLYGTGNSSFPQLPADEPTATHKEYGKYQNLIVVPGHSVFIGEDLRHVDEPEAWYLEPYQRVPGQVESFVDHIKGGVLAAAHDPAALVLFSGGETRAKAGPISEAASYWLAANGLSWFGHSNVKERALTEEYARDSFENLLFSICRFYELTGHFPYNITVVGYEFKRQRFEEHHREALNFPAERFHYVGTRAPNPGQAARGEYDALAAFTKDPFGCQGALRQKRLSRDPFGHGVHYYYRMPAIIRPLLTYCGSSPYQGHLPWDPQLVLG